MRPQLSHVISSLPLRTSLNTLGRTLILHAVHIPSLVMAASACPRLVRAILS
jgi:hypothetical protein